VFVDDRGQNLAPAAELGVKTILFDNADGLRRTFRSLGLVG